MPRGESLRECQEFTAAIPEARRLAIPGVRLCVGCQEMLDAGQAAIAGYSRRGSKDSHLR